MGEKQKLVENFLISPNLIRKIPLTEGNTKILHEGKEYKCVGAYSFPISRPDQVNYNDRIYTSALWETVIQEQKEIWEGAFGLCDHPEGDGSVKDAFCVWHNMRIENVDGEKLTVADAYLFGNLGNHANEAIEAGGKLGMSSVGYGDFKEDGKTIDESSYSIERPADWVLNPSYGVFGTIDHTINEEQEKVSEHVIDAKDDEDTVTIVFSKEKREAEDEEEEPKEESKLSEDGDTNTTDREPVKETVMSDKSQKLLEKNFRFNITSQMKEVETKESVSEKIDGYKEILALFEDVDFADDQKEKVEEALSEAENALRELADKGKELDSVKESSDTTLKEKESLAEENKSLKEQLEALQEKFEVATKMLDDLKVYTNKLKELHDIVKAEKAGTVSASEYRELSVYAEKLEKDLEEAKQQIRILEKKRNSKPKLNRRQREEFLNRMKQKREQEDEDEDEEEEDEDEEEMEENMLSLRNDNAIRAYYDDLEEANPAVKAIKSEILKAKTIVEAQKTYLNLKNLIEDVPPTRRPVAPSSDKKERKQESRQPRVSMDRVKRQNWI